MIFPPQSWPFYRGRPQAHLLSLPEGQWPLTLRCASGEVLHLLKRVINVRDTGRQPVAPVLRWPGFGVSILSTLNTDLGHKMPREDNFVNR